MKPVSTTGIALQKELVKMAMGADEPGIPQTGSLVRKADVGSLTDSLK